jgi:hypothetical protein
MSEPMRFRFTIRDLLWLTVVVAFAVGWWLDHRRLTADPFPNNLSLIIGSGQEEAGSTIIEGTADEKKSDPPAPQLKPGTISMHLNDAGNSPLAQFGL